MNRKTDKASDEDLEEYRLDIRNARDCGLRSIAISTNFAEQLVDDSEELKRVITELDELKEEIAWLEGTEDQMMLMSAELHEKTEECALESKLKKEALYQAELEADRANALEKENKTLRSVVCFDQECGFRKLLGEVYHKTNLVKDYKNCLNCTWCYQETTTDSYEHCGRCLKDSSKASANRTCDLWKALSK